ncbi:MAG: adenylyltransferase/cytidyltransferase family protein [Proteobacteria bacterium]|nr:adenylyltransferase/cytidyltransferase family protein [Pseudomonadota bacterium]
MKIKELAQLSDEIKALKLAGKKIVHCHGVFDLLHIGHIRYLRQAGTFGDVLVVTVTPDQFVDKGPHRPAFDEKLRAEGIASLGCVDFVAINKWATAEETLRVLKPDFYVKGAEFKDMASDITGKIGREVEVARTIGVQIVFADDIIFSSSNLINRYMSSFPKETQEYLEIFRERYQPDKIFTIMDSMASIKVLVIGDTILDEYQYCSALGISSKDPTLALQYHSKDLFAGGVLAVANHLAGFVDSVQLTTLLGESERHEEFIRIQLAENVNPFFFTHKGAPTTLKKRFVDGYSFNKMLEVYVMDDSGLPEDEDAQICNWLVDQLPNYDLVIAADFGHGAISDRMVKTLEAHASFLSVNTQANAGNRGFHTINRYQRADFVCLALHELNLAYRSKAVNERVLVEKAAKRLGCQKFVVTLGRRGCLVYQPGSIVTVPAFAQDVVDRVGAGDTFFSIASLAAYLGVDSEIIGFLGNVVGAEAVRVIGNQKSIQKLAIKKHITSLLK